MTYEELVNECQRDTAAFKMAFILLGGWGAKNIDSLTPEYLQGNMMTGLYKEKLVKLAKGMAEAPSEVLLAVIQRALPPIVGDGKEIPYLHDFGDEDGICPVCGAEFEYEGDNDVDDSGTIVSWTCPECGASGQAAYNGVFDRHYNVVDKDGNKIPGRDDSEEIEVG